MDDATSRRAPAGEIPGVSVGGIPSYKRERTYVDERRGLRPTIWRWIKRLWLIALVIFVIAAALSSEEVANGLMSLGGLVFQLFFAIAFMLIQFVALFWFLARSRMYEIYPGAEGINFSDYRGQPQLLERAQQIVTLLRGVKRFEQMGGEPLTGLLLEGPPGTGKTWLAQAMSTEAGVPFFFVDASSLQAMFIGVGPMKIMQMYGKARKAAKEYGASIVFIDEIDAIGASRSGVSEGGAGRMGMGGFLGFGGGGGFGLLSTMLIEMSGFSLEHGWRARMRSRLYKLIGRKPPKPTKRVLTIGATNRVATLDPALLRPGRFDKVIRVDPPTLEGRRDILTYYLSKLAHDETVTADRIARDTPGFTPADLKYILNDALRIAVFDGRDKMTYKDFQKALPEHQIGLRQPGSTPRMEDRRSTAYHESGHAIANLVFRPNKRISRVTIVKYGAAEGHVDAASEEERKDRSREDIIADLCVSLAGRAAEEEFLGTQINSMGGDMMAVRQGLFMLFMTGMLLSGPPIKDEPTEEQLKEMKRIYAECLERTRTALRNNDKVMHALVQELLEKDELISDDVYRIFDETGATGDQIQSPVMAWLEESMTRTPRPAMLVEPRPVKADVIVVNGNGNGHHGNGLMDGSEIRVIVRDGVAMVEAPGDQAEAGHGTEAVAEADAERSAAEILRERERKLEAEEGEKPLFESAGAIYEAEKRADEINRKPKDSDEGKEGRNKPQPEAGKTSPSEEQ